MTTPHETGPPLVLLTGATGYVGGRLLKALEQRGTALRCLARRPEVLRPRVGPGTQVVQGDVLDGSGLAEALEGTPEDPPRLRARVVRTEADLLEALEGSRSFKGLTFLEVVLDPLDCNKVLMGWGTAVAAYNARTQP